MKEDLKVYLIIGASSDVGKAYIQYVETQKEECIVVAHYNSSYRELEELRESFTYIQLSCIAADLTSENEMEQLIHYVKNQYGCPDYILHLPASKYEAMPIRKFDWDIVQKEIDIQVRSLAEILSAFLPMMAKREQGYGKVVVMLTSYVYNVPPKFMSHYIIAKYALLGLVKSAAIEYAEKGININALSPSMIDTKFLSNLDERQIEIQVRNSVIRKNLSAEDVIPAIDFLFSKGSDHMYGANINLSTGEAMI